MRETKEGAEIKGREGRKRGEGEKEREKKKRRERKKNQSSTAGIEPATFHSVANPYGYHAWRVDSHPCIYRKFRF